jgi:hypothetical protein
MTNGELIVMYLWVLFGVVWAVGFLVIELLRLVT